MARPRVGGLVKMLDGLEGRVIVVRRSADCLRAMDEDEALDWGMRMGAALGPSWQETYWEADVLVGGVLFLRTALEDG